MQPSEIVVVNVNLTGLDTSSTVTSVALNYQTVVATAIMTGPKGEPGQGITPGGTTGQILAKNSNTDYDTEWIDQSSDSVTSVNGQTGVVVLTKSSIGLGNVDNTSDLSKPISTLTQAALDNKPSYSELADVAYSGLKADVGLANVDNTSDATKNSASAAITNKNLTSGTNTFPTFNQSTTGSAATLTTGRTIAITGDLAYTSPSFNGSSNITAAGTLATVNSNVGSFGSASSVMTQTVNAKGLTTAAASVAIQIAESQVTNLVSDLAAKQGTISLTTTGTSGPATLISNTLNIPQYSGGGGGSGITRSIVSVTSSVTLGNTALVDVVAIVGTGGAPTLPTAIGNTNSYEIKNASLGDITVSTTSSQLIDGSSSMVISRGSARKFYSDNSNWRVF